MERFKNGKYLTLGVGAICPVCGNFSEFDFDPPEDLDPTPKPPILHGIEGFL